jgi:hypothetical protein
MTFKGPQSDIEFQVAGDDGEEFGYEYTCYDCNLVTRNVVESMFNDGHCRLADTIVSVLHIKKHQSVGDMVPNELIASLQFKLKNIATFHQSSMSPRRRKDGSHSGVREAAFHDQWLHEQGSNLLLKLLDGANLGDLSHREATIAATLIQWLGTNVGFCFLENALKRCGYKSTKIE